MSFPRLVVFLVALVITVGGLWLVLKREISSSESRRLVGPVRDVLEIALPSVGLIALLWWTWIAAG